MQVQCMAYSGVNTLISRRRTLQRTKHCIVELARPSHSHGHQGKISSSRTLISFQCGYIDDNSASTASCVCVKL